MESLLDELRSGIDRTPLRVLPVKHRFTTTAGRKMINNTVLYSKICEIEKSTLPGIDYWKRAVEILAKDNPIADRALGCMIGMAVGDAVGAPLEFLPANSSPRKLVPLQRVALVEWQNPKNTTPAESNPKDDDGDLVYTNERNSFRLARGQWTDDASMGFCIAESLLVHGAYHGGDVRVRFHNWWNFGYCNAFRHTTDRTSVGLGGNIGRSLEDLVQNYSNKSAQDVPWHFDAGNKGSEDAGNGSLMRLAPVPIRYHANVSQAMDVAEQSSYATHPGPDAANCCRFVAYFVCRAMHRPTNDETTIQTFTTQTIADFVLAETKRLADANTTGTSDSMKKLFALLQSTPPSPREACWNWTAERIELEETIENRGFQYNGYPVSSEYFGSFCMDALAMVLWAVTHSNSFSDGILQVVNLCGDADTTASIAGQMAGAFYGYSSLRWGHPSGKRMLANLRQWDPLYEIELRALLLYQDGSRDVSEVSG